MMPEIFRGNSVLVKVILLLEIVLVIGILTDLIRILKFKIVSNVYLNIEHDQGYPVHQTDVVRLL